MPSGFYEQQPSPSVRDTKANGDSQPLLTSDEVMAGTKVVMTHAERQAFLKTSRLGEIFGVAHLLPEVEEVTIYRGSNRCLRALSGDHSAPYRLCVGGRRSKRFKRGVPKGLARNLPRPRYSL